MTPLEWERLAELLTRVVVVSAVSLGAAALIFEALR
jgi:hypothetical protein